jgi:hypothetical protein
VRVTLTFRGALRLLGKSDPRVLKALDTVVGGAILASPATPLAAAWGWIDQKNEAMSLVRQLLDGAVRRFGKTRGFERYELLSAAHTTIVMAAFFDALRQQLGRGAYKSLALTEREKAVLATNKDIQDDRELIATLMAGDLFLPSLTRGFNETAEELRPFYTELAKSVRNFARGLDIWPAVERKLTDTRGDSLHRVPGAAVTMYQTYFLELSQEVPEFYLWANLSEHAATRTTVNDMQTVLRKAISEKTESLGRLEHILTQLVTARDSTPTRCRDAIDRANKSVLTETVLPAGAIDQVDQASFPTVERIYQSPRFRTARSGPNTRPADENWWEEVPVEDKIDVFFASYLASPECVASPLLLLGHPGAGKSLLTKVLTARLPAESFTAVRVPLRRVDADAPIYEQIQQALDLATNRRVHWPDLVDEGEAVTRVVFLDGLDELLQASTNSRASYLQEIEEFQRREATQQRPVAFVVTSRTVVADRVRITAGTTVLKLDEFDDTQIRRWLGVWHSHNEDTIAARRMRALPPELALRHRDLACQPLLLLMLALYAADPTAEALSSDLSSSDFYARILTNFVRREVSKIQPPLNESDIEVEEQLWRLGVAAFAMFNRDSQDISEQELGLDIVALTDSASTHTAQVGQETISRFFFVYTAEANAHRDDAAERAYEFLHATFGEYLVAHYCVKVLLEVAERSRSARRGGREFDDDLFFALLSHQTLATRRSILVFAKEIFTQLPDDSKRSCERALETLFHTYRNRSGTTAYATYRPTQPDHGQELAAYSANLVLLRVLLAGPSGVDLVESTPGLSWWCSTVGMWRALLDASGWDAICRALDVTPALHVVERAHTLPTYGLDIGFAQLTMDSMLLSRYQSGLALEGVPTPIGTNSPDLQLTSLLICAVTDKVSPDDPIHGLIAEAASEYLLNEEQVPNFSYVRLADRLFEYLAKYCATVDYALVRVLVSIVDLRPDLSALIPAIAVHPNLLLDFPDLKSPHLYLQDWVVLLLLTVETAPKQEHKALIEKLRIGIEKNLRIEPRWATSREAFLIMIRSMYSVNSAIGRQGALASTVRTGYVPPPKP